MKYTVKLIELCSSLQIFAISSRRPLLALVAKYFLRENNLIYLLALEIESRSLYKLDKHSDTELYA